MDLKEGDTLYVAKPAGGIEITPCDPDFAEALEAARVFMEVHPNALKALAE